MLISLFKLDYSILINSFSSLQMNIVKKIRSIKNIQDYKLDSKEIKNRNGLRKTFELYQWM